MSIEIPPERENHPQHIVMLTQELQTWSSHLCVFPSPLFYGCNVAASANLTGNAASYTENAPENTDCRIRSAVIYPDSANFHTGKLTLCIYTNW
ncbi:hypothetical protein [Nostoc sp.]|uniref:hypothetical protein n=1 Tax=Nostoc sp. TaxID=1180 RepID=UPI002FFC82E2